MEKLIIALGILACGFFNLQPASAQDGAADAPPPSCAGKVPTIVGAEGDDSINGTVGPDVIAGLGGDGDDYMEGNDGEDFLDGGAGTDSIDAGKGQDKCINYESNKRCNVG
ncbi:MAG: hypothetical protein IT344_06125 [Candidatus Dadabacteria bacterium]|nr:hypothetical protein [Candidatus Dadabacteria bacterium]